MREEFKPGESRKGEETEQKRHFSQESIIELDEFGVGTVGEV